MEEPCSLARGLPDLLVKIESLRFISDGLNMRLTMMTISLKYKTLVLTIWIIYYKLSPTLKSRLNHMTLKIGNPIFFQVAAGFSHCSCHNRIKSIFKVYADKHPCCKAIFLTYTRAPECIINADYFEALCPFSCISTNEVTIKTKHWDVKKEIHFWLLWFQLKEKNLLFKPLKLPTDWKGPWQFIHVAGIPAYNYYVALL